MKLSEIKTKLAELTALKRTAADELARVRARIVKAGEEIDALYETPLPRADVEGFIRAECGEIRRKIAANPVNRQWIQRLVTERVQISSVVVNGPEGAFNLLGELEEPGAAYYLLCDDNAIMNGLKPLFDACDWPSPGPSLADRRKRRAALQAEIADLRQVEADLNAAAAAAAETPAAAPEADPHIHPDLIWTSQGWKWREQLEDA